MGTVNPTEEQIRALECEASGHEGPIVMINMLRFRDVADYGASGPAGVTGRSAYAAYSKAVTPLLLEVGGRPIWRGDVRSMVIGPDGESWDEVLLVYYPSPGAFLRMVNSKAYQAIMHHRTAALSDSRLIETKRGALPAWLLSIVGVLVRARALISPRVR